MKAASDGLRKLSREETQGHGAGSDAQEAKMRVCASHWKGGVYLDNREHETTEIQERHKP